MENKKLKEEIRNSYASIAENSGSCCCGSKEKGNVFFSEDYSSVEGYVPDADMGLGCGIPTAFAQIKSGDTVIDLGSGAGNDCFVARSIVGDTGEVIGIDFTPEMIGRAEANASKMGYSNVHFHVGDIEHLPVKEKQADVVISNCVLNLVPNKAKAFSEIFRVLKPGGHLSVSDIVLKGELSDAIRKTVALYAGCISGALQYDDYLDVVQGMGFANISVSKVKKIIVPDELMLQHISAEELAEFRTSGTEIMSISVYAEKKSQCCCGCS